MKHRTLLFTLAIILAFGLQIASAKTVVLKMGGILPIEDSGSLAAMEMAKHVNEMSNGTLKIDFFPASQLGDAISQIEGVSMGSQDMMVDSGSWLAQYSKDKQVENVFKIFRDETHYLKYLDSNIYKGMEKQFLDATGARVIANNWLRGPRNFASNKPVTKLDDFTGLKIRAPQIKGYIISMKALNASPTQIPWGEVYLALSQKVVDSAESATDVLYAAKAFEVCKYLLITEHIRDNLVVIINDAKFNKLSKEHQEILRAAGRKAGEFYTERVKTQTAMIYKKLEKEGVTVNNFSDADIKMFAKLVMDKARSLEQEGMWKKGLIDQISAIK